MILNWRDPPPDLHLNIMYDIVEVAEATPCSAVHLDTPTSTASTMDACVDAPKPVFSGRPTATPTVN